MAQDAFYRKEEYVQLGGINAKASPYVEGKHQFLDLVNFDFQKPGALHQRPGSTQYTGASLPQKIAAVFEFNKVGGASYLMAMCGVSISSGAGITGAVFRLSGLGGSFLPLYLASSITHPINNASFSQVDFAVLNDYLFITQNVQSMVKWGGETFPLRLYNLPQGRAFNAAANVGFSLAATTSAGASAFLGATYGYQVGWVNDRGFHGKASTVGYIDASGATSIQVKLPFNVTANLLSSEINSGVTAMAIYKLLPGTQTGFKIGDVAVGTTFFNDTGLTLGTLASPTCLDQGSIEGPTNDNGVNINPTCVESWNNQLFLAGIREFNSATRTDRYSRVYFSEIGEPEQIEPEYFFDVRTNDGDKVTALKAFGSELLLFKQKSFHAISGDGPRNLILKEKSDQYGALNNRCVVTFEGHCWFLDERGVVEYTGGRPKIVSTPMEPIFQSINLGAAKTEAQMMYVKDRNELWCAIPTGSSSINDTIVVYDIDAKAWTKFQGPTPSYMCVGTGGLSAPTAIFGNYSGMIHFFGASLTGDNGAGITTVAKPWFWNPSKSSTYQFRRLWLDVEAAGATDPILVNFYQDYGASIVKSVTMPHNMFQSRIDFGIPAKALAPEFVHSSASFPLTINGFTIEARVQRGV
jgi:hypothetical protein